MNLEQKLELARVRIRTALRDQGADKCAVACSFGKDSMAVLHLVREMEPNILVEFTNTGVEFPDTLRHRDRVVKEWELNYVEAKSKDHTFFELVEKYGFPSRSRLDPKSSGVPKCCEYLKERPAAEIYKQLGVKLIFTGITADESRNRWFLSKRCGNYYYAKTQDLWKCHPIMDWTTEEVWRYTRENGIPINPFYEKFPEQRVGCVPCTAYMSWEENMASAFPKMYSRVQRMRGQVLIDEFEPEEVA